MEPVMLAMAGACSSVYDLESVWLASQHDPGLTTINNVCANGLTPLCMACRINRLDYVTFLLQKGASPSYASNHIAKFPLHFASDHSNGNLDIVTLLLSIGSDVSIADSDGNTPLHLACTESNVAVVKMLLAAGADITLCDVDGETALMRACFAMCVDLVDILLRAGSDPNFFNGAPLYIAARASSFDCMKLLIDAGADVKLAPFILASLTVDNNDFRIIKMLLDAGADVDHHGPLGETALHRACQSDGISADMVELMLFKGANPNAVTYAGDLPLHFACQIVSLVKVRLLLMHGADVNMADGTHTTPLVAILITHSTSSYGFAAVIRLLLAAGARLSGDMLRRIQVLVVYLADGKEAILSLLAGHTSMPTSLLQASRTAVRRCCRGNIDVAVSCLPLPQNIIQFLQFSDVPGCGYAYN